MALSYSLLCCCLQPSLHLPHCSFPSNKTDLRMLCSSLLLCASLFSSLSFSFSAHSLAHSSSLFPLLPPTISPSFLPPSSSSLQGSRRVWHFSNSRRGICTQPRPMLGKESVGVACLTEASVCLSVWQATCDWIPHISSNNTYFLP